jgi:O-acetylhomoserine (thiol)-lyase
MGFTTTLVHSDREFGVEHGNLLKPIHPGVTYGYEDAETLARVFQGKERGYTYGRQVNPTVEALEQKVTRMEGGLASIGFGTGMAAIGTLIFALLRRGDHLIASQFLFGNSASLLESFSAHGIDVSFVDATDAENVASVVQAETKMVFVETIANPRTQIADLEGIGHVCREAGLLYVVDNTLTSPYLFKPRRVGAGLVVNSLTKYIGGHGNALGGSITEMGQFDWSEFENIYDQYRSGPEAMWGISQIKKKGLRDFGASLAADAAHRLSTGCDTLALRLDRACANAAALAKFFDEHESIEAVYYPGLPDHPQFERARAQFLHPGAILSFELADGLDCFEVLNRLQTVVKATHLGDIRTLALPVAHSIFYEIGAERRAAMGIRDNLIRVSVGIEDPIDLLQDFGQALSSDLSTDKKR